MFASRFPCVYPCLSGSISSDDYCSHSADGLGWKNTVIGETCECDVLVRRLRWDAQDRGRSFENYFLFLVGEDLPVDLWSVALHSTLSGALVS